MADDPIGEAARLLQRVRSWRTRPGRWRAARERQSAEAMPRLIHGQRALGGHLHLLVIDPHKAPHRLAARLATELVEGPMSGRCVASAAASVARLPCLACSTPLG